MNGPGHPVHGVDVVTIGPDTSRDAPWGYHEGGAPLGPDGVTPLWDVVEYGTRGPPWRGRLLREAKGEVIAAPEVASGGGMTLGERPGARNTIDRVAKRILDNNPGTSEKQAMDMAKKYAGRYDRRHGR